MESSTLTEADILSEVVAPDQSSFPPAVAQTILELRFTERAIQRMNELAEKNRRDELSDAERDDMEKYLRVGNFINLMQAKARLCLAQGQ
jgi:hypothetical protein